LDWLEFFASLTSSLAWPTSAAIIALIFRGEIKAIFNRLEHLGYGDWKLTLRKDLEEAEQVALTLPPPPEPEPSQQIDALELYSGNPFDDLVRVSPRAAILDSWSDIEVRLRAIAIKVGFGGSRNLPHLQLIELLGQHSIFPSSLISLLHELREIRNLAAHTKVSSEDAHRFKKLANQTMPFLLPSLFDHFER
jgi:hypothetical protein